VMAYCSNLSLVNISDRRGRPSPVCFSRSFSPKNGSKIFFFSWVRAWGNFPKNALLLRKTFCLLIFFQFYHPRGVVTSPGETSTFNLRIRNLCCILIYILQSIFDRRYIVKQFLKTPVNFNKGKRLVTQIA
jgi:hypothetical protein